MAIISVFHGSNAKFKEFATKSKRVENDFFGGGIAYFTDDQKVALTYSRAMTRRYGGEEYLYKVDLNLSKIFDVDTVYTGAELQKFFAHIKPEAFARGAGLLKNGADKYSVLASLELGNAVMTGHDVFRGLSQGLVNSSGAEKILMKLGYDGLRYNGGDNMSAGRHNVYMPYYSKDITIRNTFKVNRRVIAESLDMPEIGYMTFSRELLPQIVDQDEFLDHLKLMGIDYTKVTINAEDVKATQSDGFDMDKVAKMMGKTDLKPVLVSSDYFILDGHHRWIAAFNKKHTFSALLIDAPILELIRIAADYYNSQYADYIMSESFAPCEEDLNEVFGGLRTHEVLYHHISANKGKKVLASNNLFATWDHKIPMTHKKIDPRLSTYTMDYSAQKAESSRKVEGTSLSRNINLSYHNDTKRWILELDRKKLRDTNKVHVIDADLVAGGGNPHDPDIGKGRDWSELARLRAIANYKGKDNLSNEFAEEFLEGDLPSLNKYLRTIWIKSLPVYHKGKRPSRLKDKDYALFDNEREFYDVLAHYTINYNVPVKYYPSGKDATQDLIDWVDDEVGYELNTRSPQGKSSDFETRSEKAERGNLERSRLSLVVANIRKSINRQPRL